MAARAREHPPPLDRPGHRRLRARRPGRLHLRGEPDRGPLAVRARVHQARHLRCPGGRPRSGGDHGGALRSASAGHGVRPGRVLRPRLPRVPRDEADRRGVRLREHVAGRAVLRRPAGCGRHRAAAILCSRGRRSRWYRLAAAAAHALLAARCGPGAQERLLVQWHRWCTVRPGLQRSHAPPRLLRGLPPGRPLRRRGRGLRGRGRQRRRRAAGRVLPPRGRQRLQVRPARGVEPLNLQRVGAREDAAPPGR
mmetsp:Transcript_132502/g.411955  ORF Transcript_132502/g.411955 Transcript_132502/m.411955 type:complete len:252 (-) Transcript_132502:977-1732(-)